MSLRLTNCECYDGYVLGRNLKSTCRYETVETSTNSRETRPPSSWDLPDLEEWLVDTAASVNENVPVEPTIDLFQQGFDRSVMLQLAIRTHVDESYVA